MSMESLRVNRRREMARRQSERRVISYEFGSEHWLEMIKESYYLWPKEDRRVQLRRETERRAIERRQDDMGRDRLNKQLEQTVELLTDEEKEVLNGLWSK